MVDARGAVVERVRDTERLGGTGGFADRVTDADDALEPRAGVDRPQDIAIGFV